MDAPKSFKQLTTGKEYAIIKVQRAGWLAVNNDYLRRITAALGRAGRLFLYVLDDFKKNVSKYNIEY